MSNEKKFAIILKDYGVSEPEYIGSCVWTKEQAEDLLGIIKTLRNCHTDDHINDEEESIY